MPNPNAVRIQVQEGAYTYVECNVAQVLQEIDFRSQWANLFYKIMRDANGHISETQYFSDEAKTKLKFKREYFRNGDDLVSGTVTTFYNLDDTVDSEVSGFFDRVPGVSGVSGCPDVIDCVSSYFATAEDIKI